MPGPAWDIQGLRKPNNAEAELLDELQVFILLEKLEWDQQQSLCLGTGTLGILEVLPGEPWEGPDVGIGVRVVGG